MYNRLFTKILDSSIWLESDVTRIVWITLLAAMDEDGYAPFSCNDNLARRANVPKESLVAALKILESPDKYNPDDEFNGRRIEKVQGGWMVLKAPYYRSLLSREIAREQNRVRVKRFREKQGVMNESLPNITEMQQSITKQSTAKQSKTKKKEEAPSVPEVEDFCQSLGLPRSDGSAMFLHWEEKKWPKNWQLTIRKWQSFGYLPSQKNKSHGPDLYREQGNKIFGDFRQREAKINRLNDRKAKLLRKFGDLAQEEEEFISIQKQLKQL